MHLIFIFIINFLSLFIFLKLASLLITFLGFNIFDITQNKISFWEFYKKVNKNNIKLIIYCGICATGDVATELGYPQINLLFTIIGIIILFTFPDDDDFNNRRKKFFKKIKESLSKIELKGVLLNPAPNQA